ncbi:hypothetical protein K0M31_003799, partial [Melipona bicolor]
MDVEGDISSFSSERNYLELKLMEEILESNAGALEGNSSPCFCRTYLSEILAKGYILGPFCNYKCK